MSQGYDKLLDLSQRPWSDERSGEVVHFISILDIVTSALLLLGAFNWGIVAWSGVDWIGSLFGAGSWPTRILHGLIGASSIRAAYMINRIYRSL